jgi:ribosomal protein S21
MLSGGGALPPHRSEEGQLAFVTLRDGEDGEGLLRRFQTSMQRSGILRDLRNRRFFRSKGEQTRLDKARSLRRLRRRQRR